MGLWEQQCGEMDTWYGYLESVVPGYKVLYAHTLPPL